MSWPPAGIEAIAADELYKLKKHLGVGTISTGTKKGKYDKVLELAYYRVRVHLHLYAEPSIILNLKKKMHD